MESSVILFKPGQSKEHSFLESEGISKSHNFCVESLCSNSWFLRIFALNRITLPKCKWAALSIFDYSTLRFRLYYHRVNTALYVAQLGTDDTDLFVLMLRPICCLAFQLLVCDRPFGLVIWFWCFKLCPWSYLSLAEPSSCPFVWCWSFAWFIGAVMTMWWYRMSCLKSTPLVYSC